MILTIKGADFSGAGIGTNNSIRVQLTKTSGVSGSIVQNNFEKDQVISTATVIANLAVVSGYENLTVTVTMGGTSVNAWYSNGVVTIPSNTTITGDIKINASAILAGSSDWEWISMVLDPRSLGVTSIGTGRVSNSENRFSTVSTTEPSGILIPAGKTIHIKGLASGTYPVRFDYVYSTVNALNPESGSTTPIEGLVGTGSNYDTDNYFPINTEGGDTAMISNSSNTDYYWFAFAGLTKTEKIQLAIDTYNIQYYIN